ncbi:Pyrroline-5-carboxylate reductase [Lasiodiplodia hormozganensis]|uniref:Pyrroline-5-carboxylate reductase n=1 Tax=Lasiodiplodia hormozganensis TaxID=869390 RepID=A0AA39YDI6_9PEZI|nr:Pyrroline-5-carboxylate reductase [Lasiodiplodia hormozganensis]
MARDVLGIPEVQKALKGKLVISMLAGLSSVEILKLCVSTADEPETSAGGPIVTKAVPNIAARCRQSMTILELPESGSIPPREAELTEWMFGQVGSVKWLAEGLVNAGSMLMTACLAALSIPLEGLLDGSVAEGLRRADAMEIAVQGVQGLGGILALGMHPAVVRESISSPRGCTIQSLLTVEKAATRAVFAQALIDGTRHLQPKDTERKG